jgi:hypothetical protein
VDIVDHPNEAYEVKYAYGSVESATAKAAAQLDRYAHNSWGPNGSRFAIAPGDRLLGWAVWFYGPPDYTSPHDIVTNHSTNRYYAWSPVRGVVVVAKESDGRVPERVKDRAVQGDYDFFHRSPLKELLPDDVPIPVPPRVPVAP